MKIQGLAIIFVIIILPIAIIIGEYASTQIELIQLEQLYDSRLITATYDALKAFQINTFNDASSDIADSKISSIEASANAFYNSMELSFGLQGYSKNELQSYVPALVYTMYDGYYIYSPYTNIAKTENGLEIDLDSNNIEYGFKPYVYYSCRYKMGANSDFIINYSLDNYITVQGTIKGVSVYKSGYLVTLANSKNEEGLWVEDGQYYYSGIEILPEANLDEYTDEELTNYLVSSLTDYLIESDGSTKAYKYTKINGTKYYWNEEEEYVFYILGGERIKQATKDSDYASYQKYVDQIKINTNAISYYSSAYEFTKWVNDNLGNLKTSDAVTKVANSGSGNIFENSQIEYADSNFNLHRKEVIRYSIESNLSVAIANFNNYTDKTANFQMPKLKETEWELLQNEISIISFLQGLNLGGKIYNGYTVVTNAKTEEVVKEDRIYISTNDGYYHKINDEHLINGDYNISDVKSGVLDLDFEIRKDGATGLHYMHKIQLGCYSSIVGQQNVNSNYDSIYEYLQNTNIDSQTKQIYYIALGRERWGTYKIENPSNIQTILGGMESQLDGIVNNGLIRYYNAKNNTGSGHSDTVTTWKDLTGNHDASITGARFTSNALSFDATDDKVNIGPLGSLNEFTVEFNLKINSTTMSELFKVEKSSTSLKSSKTYASFGTSIFTSAGGGTGNGTSFNHSISKNLTMTFKNGTFTFFVDGINKHSKVFGEAYNDLKWNSSTNASIGGGDFELYAFRIYNRVLAPEEILQNIEADRNTNVESSSKEPTITIKDKEISPNAYISSHNPTLKAKIEVNSQIVLTNVKYIFSNSTTAPTTGWQEIPTDGYYGSAEVSKQVTTSGQWYLYVKASNAEGEVTKKVTYDIQKDTNRPNITISDKGADIDTTNYSIEYGYTNVIIAKTITSIDGSTVEGEGISGIKVGSGSYSIIDPDGNIYNLIDYEGNVLPNSGLTFTTGNEMQIEIAANKVGTWTLTVTIQDNAGNESTVIKEYKVEKQQVKITIENTDGQTSYTVAEGESVNIQKKIRVYGPCNYIEYIFSDSSILPVEGWKGCSTYHDVSKQLTTSDVGQCYLHVRVTKTNGEIITQSTYWTVN